MNMKRNFFKFSLVLGIFISIMLTFYNINTYAGNSLTQYKIDAQFNDKLKTITGSEDITYTNNYSTSLSNIVLHLYPDSYNKSSSKPSIGQGSNDSLPEAEIGDI